MKNQQSQSDPLFKTDPPQTFQECWTVKTAQKVASNDYQRSERRKDPEKCQHPKQESPRLAGALFLRIGKVADKFFAWWIHALTS